MRRSPLLIGLIAVLACDPRATTRADDAAERAPASLVVATGDAQTGLAGTMLGVPLGVRALTQAGVPAAGLTVRFEVTRGVATLTAPMSSTRTGPTRRTARVRRTMAPSFRRTG